MLEYFIALFFLSIVFAPASVLVVNFIDWYIGYRKNGLVKIAYNARHGVYYNA